MSADTRRRFPRLRMLFSRRRPLSCQEVVELVTAYLEDALDPVTRARFVAHLEACDGCATYLEEIRVTVSTLGTLHEDDLDPIFRSRLMDAFAEATGSW
jgi:anti-sigma factor RsiW